jgi:hypothetical protein
MASINQICADIVRNVDAALGCAVVDLNSGLLLGVSHNIPYFTQSYLDAVAAAAVDMFRGRTIAAVEDMISNMRGDTTKKHLISEVQMTTDKTFHFMCVIPEKPDALVVLITSKKANLGMGWSQVRLAIPKIAPLCP